MLQFFVISQEVSAMNFRLRTLGQSDLHLSPVGIGTAPIGSSAAWRIYWGPQDEAQAIRAIKVALDLGVNWIDTAPFYGWGRPKRLSAKRYEENGTASIFSLNAAPIALSGANTRIWPPTASAGRSRPV